MRWRKPALGFTSRIGSWRNCGRVGIGAVRTLLPCTRPDSSRGERRPGGDGHTSSPALLAGRRRRISCVCASACVGSAARATVAGSVFRGDRCAQILSPNRWSSGRFPGRVGSQRHGAHVKRCGERTERVCRGQVRCEANKTFSRLVVLSWKNC